MKRRGHVAKGAAPEASGVWYVTATCPRFGRERHAELELLLVVRGSCAVTAGGEHHELTRGALLWCAPGQWHEVTRISKDLVMWAGMFGGDLVRALSPDERHPRGGQASECVRLSPDELAALSQRAFELVQHRDEFRFCSELEAFLVSVSRAGSLGVAAPSALLPAHPAVVKAAELLTYTAKRWSLKALAKHAGLSPCQLSRLFHAEMGVTLEHFGNHQRVQRFEALYGDGSRGNLLDAALDAGFGSYSQFFRVYRKVAGRSPEAHRRRVLDRRAPIERWIDPVLRLSTSSAG